MDATCKVQDNIHVFRLVHNMCPGFWVHITFSEVLFKCLLSIFPFSEYYSYNLNAIGQKS